MIDDVIQSAFSEERPTIAILGVPLDNITLAEAITRIEEMIASRRPHYLATANVDFLVQARSDVELRRILLDAHLVLCDGTPLVWVSGFLGNRLPERVAGADLVPLFIKIAAANGYRLFFLGASPESAAQAVARMKARLPDLQIAGCYSPPFNKLLEMDHEEIARRIAEARPDVLFVCFGCPKQEKWIAMHYRSLGVPVSIGLGGTIDFLAGQVSRAPIWMQRSGTEWLFRLLQEPRRLFRRYVKDLWVFGWSILPQCWHLRSWRNKAGDRPVAPAPSICAAGDAGERAAQSQTAGFLRVRLPEWLDYATVRELPELVRQIASAGRDCILDLDQVRFIDSTGVGLLIRIRKSLLATGGNLVLLAPSHAVRRALELMRLSELFDVAGDIQAAEELIRKRHLEAALADTEHTKTGSLVWHGEITAANADHVWTRTLKELQCLPNSSDCRIDMTNVRFIDSSGLGLMVRARKLAQRENRRLSFTGLQPPVRNVLRIAQLEGFLLNEEQAPARKRAA